MKRTYEYFASLSKEELEAEEHKDFPDYIY